MAAGWIESECDVRETNVPLRDVDWNARRVTILGLGRHGGGVAAARHLAMRGARVTISDIADRDSLAGSLTQLADVPIEAVHLGGHDHADLDADFVVVNPAVKITHPALHVAREAGARLISETELFLEACPARVIGVTGTTGKSTTCSMLHAVLLAAGRTSWLGGNIGRSLLRDVPAMTADDWVVLEISSFQLSHLGRGCRMPQIAVVTNCSPHHLDWHGTYANYADAKQRLVIGGCESVVLNRLDGEVSTWRKLAKGCAVDSWALERLGALLVSGKHNRQNAACAAAAAEIIGIERGAIRDALQGFPGLPHRLEFAAEIAGRRFYNDSKSTMPEATVAALAAVDGNVWLLAGGDDKGADFTSMAAAIAARVAGAAFFGAAGERIHGAVRSAGGLQPCVVVEHLRDALAWCWSRAQSGDTILLSPGCASLGQFRDFAHRGETFCTLVSQLAARGAPAPVACQATQC
jgi:UDP-N-acetylmuramoylalanine--D-glutamate ligase